MGPEGSLEIPATAHEIDATGLYLIPGPRIIRAGPTLNGAPNGPHHRVIDTPEAARQAVAELSKAGFDLHAEIRVLAQAGLTATEALRAGSRGPGAAAGGDPLHGRLVAGAPTDLVILRQNAFDSLDALDTIEAVVLRGELLDRNRLDTVLARLESD